MRIAALHRSIPAVLILAAGSAWAQPDRITGFVDSKKTAVVRGSVSPLARAAHDLGPVEPSFNLPYITLLLKPGAAQQADLAQLLASLQDRSSAQYQHWLSPEEYADRFGVSIPDMLKIRSWLEAAGFKIVYTARGRDWIAFSGAAAQVEAAFHTPIHRIVAGSETHFSIVNDPAVPAALAPLVAGFMGLHDFHPRAPGHPKPAFNDGSGQNTLAPGDLAAIYDMGPLYEQGTNGSGQKIAVVGQTELVVSDIQGFRTTFGLGSQSIQTVLAGSDPGVNADALGEADLDLEWAGAVARKASFIYVYSTDATVAAFYAIDQNLAPIVSESFGECEADVPGSLVQTLETEAQKANTMGITWLASAGDTGAAACDPNGSYVATMGPAVLVPASIPEVTAVGGSEFDEGNEYFWGPLNGAFGATAISYIPEVAWNDTAYGGGLSSGGGGVSILYAKPAWQSGLGVPADGARDVPDIAMDASNDHDPYNVYTSGQWERIGGTSAAAPVFAGILALLNEHLGSGGVGNVNQVLYSLAQSNSGVFHDIVTGNNMVPCGAGTPGCTNGEFGYSAGPGYDLATGLGSVDAYNLVLDWHSSSTAVSISTLAPASTTAGGTAFTLTVSGSNFTSGAAVNWAGTALSTTFVSATQLKAAVTAGLIATAGSAAITVSSGGNTSNTVYFTINPAAPQSLSISNQRLTTEAPPASGCVLPPAQIAFATSSKTVYLYFSAVVTAQDTLSNDWLAPDGSTVAGTNWPSQAGNFCFTGANLAIASLTGSKLGSWQARIYDNGKVVASVSFTVNTTVSSAPVVNSVKNSASYASNAVSPGEIVVIFGSGLGPVQFAGLTLNSSGLVNTESGGTTVMFNGTAAPMVYSLAGQVAAIVPYEVTGSTAQVTVSYQGQTSAPFTVNVAAAVPGLFTSDSSGAGEVAALNQDSSVNSVLNPAAQGSVVVLFGTGEGQTSPAGADGKLATAPLPKPVQNVTVTIGGMPANVQYYGAAPGEVAGVLQVNANIPAGVFGSAVPVVVTVGNTPSQPGATIAVAPPPGQSVFAITSQEVAASVSSTNGILNCIAPPAQTSFQETAAAAWVYLTYQGAKAGDTLEFSLVHPSGTVDATQKTVTLKTAAGCAAESFAIQGAEAATEPGNWRVRVSYNTTLQTTLAFTILAPSPTYTVTAKETTAALVTDSSGNPNYCAMPTAQTNFSADNPYVWVWFTFNGGLNGDLYAFHWIHPSGQLDSYQPSTVIDFGGEGCMAWSFPITATTDLGNWQVQVSRNGATLFTLPFAITVASFGVTNSMTTHAVNLNSNGGLSCTAPSPASIFLTTDTAVGAWLAFNAGTSGDVFTFNWIHPSGALDPTQSTVTLDFSGAGCLYASLNISNAGPAADPGAWFAKVYRNGTLVLTLQFTIGSSSTFAVTNQMTTAAIVEDAQGNLTCTAPQPQSIFNAYQTDAVWVWFSYEGAEAGDVISFDIEQYGGPEAFTNPLRLTASGSGCVAAPIPYNLIFEQNSASVSRNNEILFTLPFTVTY